MFKNTQLQKLHFVFKLKSYKTCEASANIFSMLVSFFQTLLKAFFKFLSNAISWSYWFPSFKKITTVRQSSFAQFLK